MASHGPALVNRQDLPLYLAALLLVLVALSPRLVNGIQAKYVSYGSASSTSRVAKLGVTPKLQGSLFGTDLGPGTTGSMTLSLDGKAEVSLRAAATVVYTGDGSELCVPAGYYDVNYSTRTVRYHATSNAGMTNPFRVATDYYPLRYTVKNGAGTTVVNSQPISAVKTWLEGSAFPGTLAPNRAATSLGTYTVSYAWSGSDTNANKLLLWDSLLTWTNKPAGFSSAERLCWSVVTVQVD